ncbi:thioredoxin family protein [Mycoplasma sp. P36-A1]|uniref:thioredoxin family protein n=1 Tax=Mycoplasma sp. P36-A1 TaxID=3252900 RepID=UPI003C2E8184
MKKLLSLLTVFFLAIAIVGCSKSSVEVVDPAKVTEKIDAKESFILVASSTTCEYCKQYEPIVKEFTDKKENVNVVKVEIDQISDQSEKSNFINKFVISGTPTTIIISKGEVKMTKAGVLTEAELEDYTSQYITE